MRISKKIGLVVLSLLMALAVAITAVPTVGAQIDGASIPKYQNPLPLISPMPRTDTINLGKGKKIDYYEIAVRQFQQQILPPGWPATTVWGYGSENHTGSFSYPARTIEARVDNPVRVKWINKLVDKKGNYLPHLLPIDQTLHWANPPTGPDMMGMSHKPYTGPVPMVAHLHGAHVTQDSDGYPEAWFLPDAKNIQAGYAKYGSRYLEFKNEAETAYGEVWKPGTSVYQYPNDQRAATLWFHDHSLGMTRANVYAGPVGFYLVRGGPDDLKAGLPTGAYEVPLLIQDKSFNEDGSLFYPADRAFFEGLNPFPVSPFLKIPFIGEPTIDGGVSDISPIWNPEFFGNTMVVNGKTWPYLNVEQRRYRFRILNGSDSRFLMLKLSNDQSIWVIGNDGGFLAAPAEIGLPPLARDALLIAPAERLDIIIDFTGVPLGTEIILQNLGPDEPFGGGTPGGDFDPADPASTGQVMKFVVNSATLTADASLPPNQLVLPAITSLGAPTAPDRSLSLNELMSDTVFTKVDENGNLVAVSKNDPGAEMFGPAKAQLGEVAFADGIPSGIPHPWMDTISENPGLNVTEEWVLYNFTADAHPIHLHQIQFQVIKRIDQFGIPTDPEPWETGFKDTVIAYPGDEGNNPGITRVRVKFDIPGLFVWHCHILSHEDNEMMRPICVGGGCENMPM